MDSIDPRTLKLGRPNLKQVVNLNPVKLQSSNQISIINVCYDFKNGLAAEIIGVSEATFCAVLSSSKNVERQNSSIVSHKDMTVH